MLAYQPALVPSVPEAKIPVSGWPLGWSVAWTLLIVAAPWLPDIKFFEDPAGYLPLHMGLEFVSMAVCAMVVALGWNLRSSQQNSHVVILSAAFLYIGLAIFAHTLSFKGMPNFFTASAPEKAIFFWFAERVGGAVGIIALLFIHVRQWPQIHCHVVMVLTALAGGITWQIGLYHGDWIPRTFIEGQGLTSFKIAAEYAFSALYAAAGIVLLWRAKQNNSGTSLWLGAAAWTLALAGLFFSLYSSVTDILNVLGHVYKTSAYWMIYRALFAGQIQAPVRALVEHESRLEHLVETRTVALSNALGQFRIFVEQAPTAIAMLDKDMKYVAASARWGSEFSREQSPHFVGSGLYQQHPNLPPSWRPAFESAVAGLPVEQNQELWLPGDGSERWLRWAAYPWRDEAGIVGGVIIGAEDITELKLTEAALRQEKQFSDDIINSLPGIFYMLDEGGHHAGWNRRLEEVSGYRGDELAAMSALQMFDPETALLVGEKIKEVFERGESWVEASLKTRDGSLIPYHLSGRRMTVGTRPYVVGVGIDITERRAAEEKLKAQEAQFRQLSESLPQLVWTCEPGGACTYVSPQWIAYTGVKLIDPLGFGWLDYVHPDDRAVTNVAWRAAQGDSTKYDVEYRLRRHDGTYRWFRSRAVSLTDNEGKTLKWFGTSTDIDDLKQAQEALRLATERLETALKASSVSAFSQDADLRYTWTYNPALGHSASEVLGKQDGDLVERAEDAVRTEAIKRAVMTTGRGQRQEIVVQHNGMNCYFELVVDPLRDSAGEVVGVTCAALDITERKATELVLRRSEESLRLALTAARMNVFEHDLVAGRIKHRGPGSFELGLPGTYSEEDFLARVHPEDRAGLLAAINSPRPDCPIYSHEYRFRMPDGSYRWLADQAQGHFDRDGLLVQLQGIYWDVTERKRNEHKLKCHAERQVMLLDIASHLLLAWDDGSSLAHSIFERIYAHLEGDIGFYFRLDPMNHRLELLASFGTTPDEDRQVRQIELGHGICGQVAASRTFMALDAGEIERAAGASFIHAIGLRAYICHPLQATDGELLGTLAIGSRQRTGFSQEEIDFLRTVAYFMALSLERLQAKTEVERLNTELEHRVEMRTAELETTNKELQGFTYAASHDMKGPLGRINTFSTLLERNYRDRLEGDGLLFLDFIRRNANRLSALIEDLLSHAQIEQSLLNLTPVNIEEVVRQVLDEMDDEVRDIGAVIQLNLPETPILVRANHHGLTQVLRNLVGNALKYSVMAPPPTIEVSAVAQGDTCRICVEDNGVGFDMVYHDKIFEIFRRLHTYEEFPGSGVGLALVKKAMDRMQGKVWAESAPGQGARFFLEFQIAATDSACG